MAQNRYYSSTAQATTLNGGITGVAGTIVVNGTTGFPVSYPYTLILERDTVNEEVVEVTAASGFTLTVTRGVDGTAGVAHTTGAKVEHGVSARDYTEPQVHITGTSGVHGVTGSVVGTTDTQTLSGKTIALGSNTVSGTTAQFNAALTDNDFATLAGVETFTNKTVDLASNALTGTTAQFNAALSDNDFATLAGTETLTNKTLTGATLDATSILDGITAATIAADHGAWTDFSTSVTVKDGGTTAISITTTVARYIQVGKIVIAHAEVTCNAATTNGAVISLPVAGKSRGFAIGVLGIFGTSTPAAQTGLATMFDANANSLVPVSYANGFQNVSNGHVIRYTAVYEAA